jgi:hypothetical protein
LASSSRGSNAAIAVSREASSKPEKYWRTTVKTLEEFLNGNIEKGHNEFRIVAKMVDKYTTSFYIHCFGHDSDTLDFEVDENTLTPDPRVTRMPDPPKEGV